MLNPIDDYVSELAEQVVQQQELTFHSYEEAQQHLANTNAELRHAIQQGNQTLKHGLTQFIALDCGFVSDLSSELLEHLEDTNVLSDIVQSRIMHNDDVLPQFMEAMNHFYGCGDFYKERCVIAVLMMLFPVHPQPYVYLGSLIWRVEGIDAAARFYIKMIEALEDPALDYFAAECFYEQGRFKKAHETLQRALNNTETAPAMYSDLRLQIQTLLAKCGRK